MSPLIDWLSLLMDLFFLFGAFSGPERNPAQIVPSPRDKVEALTQLAARGETRLCEDILATIRAKKKTAEESLMLQLRAKKEIEAGIANDYENMQGAGRMAPRVMERIKSHQRTLEIIKHQEARLGKLIPGRIREARAFALLVWLIRAVQALQKQS
jgi:hypothetical protein